MEVAARDSYKSEGNFLVYDSINIPTRNNRNVYVNKTISTIVRRM